MTQRGNKRHAVKKGKQSANKGAVAVYEAVELFFHGTASQSEFTDFSDCYSYAERLYEMYIPQTLIIIA